MLVSINNSLQRKEGVISSCQLVFITLLRRKEGVSLY